MRKILGVTGIRSEYDIMSSVFKSIQKHPILELGVVVTGAHLSAAHGRTIAEIINDKIPIIDQVESLISGNELSSRVKGLGIQLQGLVQSISRFAPDILLVLGDREESISTALAGAYMNIPVAHIAGGDRVVGNVDDQVRHAVSSLASIHFTTSQDSADRLIKMGEQPERVFNVGNPGLDRMLQTQELDTIEVAKNLSIDLGLNEPYVILIQHTITSEFDSAYDQMKITLEALRDVGIKTIVSYPNSDAGSDDIIRALGEVKHLDMFKIIPYIPRIEFVNLMRKAKCLIGNSSAGILEAPLLKLPVINVGNRQKGRLHAENVRFIDHDKSQIVEALNQAIYDEVYRAKVAQCHNPFGNGHSSSVIAEILASIEINNFLRIKDKTY